MKSSGSLARQPDEVRRAHACGTMPEGAAVRQHHLTGLPHTHKAPLVSNTTRQLLHLPRASGTFGGLSLTINLLKITRRRPRGRADTVSARPPCEAYLGVGHMHRGEGQTNRKLYRRRRAGTLPWGSALPRRQRFAFGFRYTSFFYTLRPRPPFETLAVSPEFCVGALQDSTDCESIQFISGLALSPTPPLPAGGSTVRNYSATAANPALLMSYGVNDCEARLAKLPLNRVWSMLRPLLHEGHVCA